MRNVLILLSLVHTAAFGQILDWGADDDFSWWGDGNGTAGDFGMGYDSTEEAFVFKTFTDAVLAYYDGTFRFDDDLVVSGIESSSGPFRVIVEQIAGASPETAATFTAKPSASQVYDGFGGELVFNITDSDSSLSCAVFRWIATTSTTEGIAQLVADLIQFGGPCTMSETLAVTGALTSAAATFTAAANPVLTAVRTTTGTTGGVIPLVIRGETSGDMTDGFDLLIDGEIQDNAAGPNVIARIRMGRDGADNQGDMSLQTATTGGTLTTGIHIDDDQNVTVPNGALTVAESLEFPAYDSSTPGLWGSSTVADRLETDAAEIANPSDGLTLGSDGLTMIESTGGLVALAANSDIADSQVIVGNGGTYGYTTTLDVQGDVEVDGDTILGDSNTDTITCVGRLILRTVNDAGMAATAGTTAEVVFNANDSKAYLCTSGGSPATWAALN